MSSERVSRLLGMGWFITCAILGTFVLLRLLETQRALFEALFPLYLAGWSTLFFLGRATLGTFIGDKILAAKTVSERVPETFDEPLIARPQGTRRINKPSSIEIDPVDMSPVSYVWNRSGPHGSILEELHFHAHAPHTALPRSKSEWTVFRVPSADAILQGIVTPTADTDFARIQNNQALLEFLLNQLFASQATRSQPQSFKR